MRVGIEETDHNILNTTYNKPTANIILKGKELRAFPLGSGIRQRYPLLWLSFNMVLEVLTMAIREEK